MNGTLIHPTAIVGKSAELGENVSIGPYSIIEDRVKIGDNTEIRSHVTIAPGTTVGSECRIHSGAVIATEPQDLKFGGEDSYVEIGDRTVVREFATINRATKATYHTRIGSDCLIMTYCHVAHDCHIGDNVIISNTTQLAGHVTIQDWVIIGGVAKIHQFCTIGKHSFIGADIFVTKDVSPFTLIGRKPPRIEGINKIGLRRRGFSAEVIAGIEEFYDLVFFSGFNTTDGINEYLKTHQPIDEVQVCIDFINASNRGVYR